MANFTLDYTGAEVNELLNKIDTAFGEETVKGGTLTWDGDMTGKVCVEFEVPGGGSTAYMVKLSGAIPTFDDLQGGGTITTYAGGESTPDEWGNDKNFHYIDMGNVMLDENGFSLPVIAKEDNTNVMDMLTLPEKGVYVMCVPMAGMYIGSFTINGYTNFEGVEIKTIDPKYLPVDYIKQLIAEVTG